MPKQAAGMQASDWDDLRLALVVARGGSLASASRLLGVDQTTVSRRLKAAEARLGARLFERIEAAIAWIEEVAAGL